MAKPCMIHKRHEDTSTELTEVRTVLGRADSALARIEYEEEHPGYDYIARKKLPLDPEHDAMKEAMSQVVDLLEPWEKCPTSCGGRK